MVAQCKKVTTSVPRTASFSVDWSYLILENEQVTGAPFCTCHHMNSQGHVFYIIPSLRWPKSRERSMGETQGLTSVREMPQYSLQSPRLSARPQWPWEAHPSTGSPGHWTEEVVLVCSVNLSRCSSWNSEWSNDKGLTHLSSFSVSTCYLDLYIWWYHLQVPNQGVKYCEDSKAPASAVQILLQRSWSCATSNSKSLFFQSICPSWAAPW